MSTIIMIEITMATLLSLLAVIFSAYGIFKSNKRSDGAEIQKLSSTLSDILARLRALEENSPSVKSLGSVLATLTTKLETIEAAVLGKPTLSEQVMVHDQKMKDLERRMSIVENKIATCVACSNRGE